MREDWKGDRNVAEKIPLVLLPAFMTTRALWVAQVAALSDIASIHVVELSPYDSIDSMAEAVLERAPDHFALAGLSLGGFTAFEIMRRASDRVSRLALVSTGANLDTPERMEARKKQVEAVRAGKFDEVAEGLVKAMQSPTRPFAPAAQNTLRQMVWETGPECFLRQQNAMVNRPDSRPDLAHIACPTLVVHGRNDQPWPIEGAEEMARSVSHARFVAIDDCGHLSTLDRPAEVTVAMRDWLLS
jgi:pimeloyl-ACP methyl ester carboxylesterase